MSRYIVYTDDKISKLEKQGRGKGEQDEYQPWIKVGEVPSKGRSHRIPGIRDIRIHHFLSDLEMYYFYQLSWIDAVIDIREQYPLPRAETLIIANELNYSHPKYTDTKVMTVMTTDLLLTVKTETGQELIACAVKPANEVIRTEGNRRTLEKLCIEKTYWEKNGVIWNLVTEESFNMPRIKIIMFLLGKRNNPLFNKITYEKMGILTNMLADEIINQPNTPIKYICRKVDYDMYLESGDTLAWMHYMAANKIFPINLDYYNAQTTAEIAVDINTLRIRRQFLYENITNF